MHLFLDAAAFGLVYAVIAAAAAAIMVAFQPGPAVVDQRARKCGACERFCGRKRRKNAQNGPNRLTANSGTTTNTCRKLHEQLADYFKRLI
jgi:hypothetical protein